MIGHPQRVLLGSSTHGTTWYMWMGRGNSVLEPENLWPLRQSVNQQLHAAGAVGAGVPP